MQVANEKRLMLYTVMPSFVYYLNYIFKLFGINGRASVIYYPFITIFSAFLFLTAFSRSYKQTSACCAVLWISLIFSSLLGNYTTIFGGISSTYSFLLSDLNLILSTALPVCYLYYLGTEYDVFFKEIAKPSILIVVMQAFVFIITLKMGRYSISDDYMSFSYLGIIGFVGCFYNWKQSVVYKIFACVSSFMLLISGCRGAVLTWIIFLFVLWFMSLNLKNINGVVGFVVSLLCVGILAINIQSVLVFLSSKLAVVGFTSRSISKFIDGSTTFFASQGRDDISMMLSNNMSLFGSGILGDRTLVNTYAHNWVIEVVYDFGYLFGSVLCLAIAYLLIKTFILSKRYDDANYKYLVAYAASMILGKYMFSDSLFTSCEFILAVCILLFVKNRIAYEMENYHE